MPRFDAEGGESDRTSGHLERVAAVIAAYPAQQAESLQLSQQRLAEAAAFYRKAIPILERIVNQAPAVARYAQELAQARAWLATLPAGAGE